MGKSEFIGMGSSNKEPLSLEEHQQLGKSLKMQANFLESAARRIGKSVENSKAIQKDIDIARKALARVPNGMYSSMMQDFSELPNSELLPVYLGRLEQSKGDVDDK
jgi:hypothetical protein